VAALACAAVSLSPVVQGQQALAELTVYIHDPWVAFSDGTILSVIATQGTRAVTRDLDINFFDPDFLCLSDSNPACVTAAAAALHCGRHRLLSLCNLPSASGIGNHRYCWTCHQQYRFVA